MSTQPLSWGSELQTSVGDPNAIRVALLLPESPTLRLVRRVSEIAAALVGAKTADERPVEVTVGLPEPSERKWRRAERTILTRVPNAVIRRAGWIGVPVKNARRMFANLPRSLDLDGIDQVAIPRDWGWNFQDCDLWLSFADLRAGAILPLRPITHYCGDLAQRYVPTMITPSIHDPYWNTEADAFRIWRQGLVLTSDPDTVADIISYAGVRRERIEVVPDVLDALPSLPPVPNTEINNYSLLWLLAGNATDDLANALEALAAYFREEGQVDVIMAYDSESQVNTHFGIGSLSHDQLELYNALERFPYRSLEELERMLPRVGAIWSSRIAGGEGEHVHDAARAGRPLLAPRLPILQRTAERLGVQARFYGLDDPLAITDCLHALERSIEAGTTGPSPATRGPSEEQSLAWGFIVDRMIEHRHAA